MAFPGMIGAPMMDPYMSMSAPIMGAPIAPIAPMGPPPMAFGKYLSPAANLAVDVERAKEIYSKEMNMRRQEEEEYRKEWDKYYQELEEYNRAVAEQGGQQGGYPQQGYGGYADPMMGGGYPPMGGMPPMGYGAPPMMGAPMMGAPMMGAPPMMGGYGGMPMY